MIRKTIKDNTSIPEEDLKEVETLVKCVANKTLEALEKNIFVFPLEKSELEKDQMVIRSENNNYHTGNVMGFLGKGDQKLIIRSRFTNGDNDFFLQYMLNKVLDIPNVVELKTTENKENEIFYFLMFIFPHYLKAAMRKGLFKQYVKCKYNDINIKGSIDIARHIKQNTPFLGKVAYNQREFSYDNYLMELVRHTIEFIRTKENGSKILALAKEEIKLVEEATPKYKLADRKKIIDLNKKSPIRHAYFIEYIYLQKLCIMILQNRKDQIGDGPNQIYGVLFDGAWLWEEYINKIIGENFYHPNNRFGGGGQRLFHQEKDEKGKEIGLIYPDFIGKQENNRIIADAKYKPIDNIGNRDYLQVLAYMFRFDSKKGYYLYPKADEGTKPLKLNLNSGTTYEKNVSERNDISVTKLGLKIPQNAESYADFVDKIDEYEKIFKKKIISEQF